MQPKRDDHLDLTSMYLDERPHVITLHLGPERDGVRQGTMTLDPNQCGLNAFGDRTWCTRMAGPTLEVTTTHMRTLDPGGHGRVLHKLEGHHGSPVGGETRVNATLIEYPRAGLWYLLYPGKDERVSIIPMFAAELFAFDPAGTINMRYGVPMREVLARGDAEEMKAEVDAVEKALAALDGESSVRSRARVERVDEVRAALAELKAALAKLEP